MNSVARLRTVPLNATQVYLSSWPEFLLVLSVFSKELATRRLFGVDFDLFAYPFAIILLLSHIRNILVSRAIPWSLYLYLLTTSLISIAMLQLGFGGFLKQMIPILIIFTVNFYVIGKYDWRNIFKLYVKFAYYSAIFGIIQVILSFGGVNILIKIPGRLDSISYEPSHYAAILVPALLFTFFHYRQYKKYFFVMLAALVLTFNLTGYLAFLLVVSIAYINPIYILVTVPLLYYLVFYVFVDFNENFNMRIVETQAVFKGDLNILNRTVDANGTTISLYSNLMVARHNLETWNILGSGLGGHEETYHRFYEGSPFTFNYYYGLNAPSGHSLTIRVFSELGIVGLLLYIAVLVRRVILLDKGMFRSISLACLSHFVCKSFKLGGIIDYGTPFFLAMLFINFAQYKFNNAKTLVSKPAIAHAN